MLRGTNSACTSPTLLGVWQLLLAQFGGPAATLALVHLTNGERFAKLLAYHTIRVCTLGMLLVWAYVIVYLPKTAGGLERRGVPLAAVPAEEP
jgi:hypothetical protein